jgi:hypothetical protein
MEAVLLALAQAPKTSHSRADNDCKDTDCALSACHQPQATSFIADQGHQLPENVHLLTAASAAPSCLISPMAVPSSLSGPTQTAMSPSTELICSARSKPEYGGRLTARRAQGYGRQQAAGSLHLTLHSRACIPL